LVESVVAACGLNAPQHLELVTDLPDPPVAVKADRRGLTRALTNLVDNAIKYSPEGGRVTVHLASEEEGTTISVSDTGIGMTPTQVSKLFQPFTRVLDESQHKIRGTGVGLYSTKRLVEAHGGDIWAESEYGRGSVFSIRLPN